MHEYCDIHCNDENCLDAAQDSLIEEEIQSESIYDRYFKIRYAAVSSLICISIAIQCYSEKESDIFKTSQTTIQYSALSLGIMMVLHDLIEKEIHIYKQEGARGIYNSITSYFDDLYSSEKEKLEYYHDSCNNFTHKIYQWYIKTF
jgi:hypothetical protein